MRNLFIFCVFCVGLIGVWGDSVTIEGTRGPKWGDITGQYAFQERVTKQKIPFIKRDTTIEYPVGDPNGKAIVVPKLRGIEHINLVDKAKTECGDPKVELIEGGPPDTPHAKLEITAERGCPLDSIVYFFTNK